MTLQTFRNIVTYEIAAPKKSDTDHVAGISREKMDKRREHDAGKPKLNRIKQIFILAWSITKRKPDIRRSGEKDKENAPQHKIRKTD
jgi:hypothetical protein